MKERVILHSDMNSCYASIEVLHRPGLRGKPVAVGGDPELRHGIVLAKTPEAKRCGVKTGMALWEARQICPDIIFVPPHYDRYMRFSGLAREIYGEYTNKVEPFGLDESWLDVTESTGIRGSGEVIAEEIRNRMKRELGITVSVGVSWNKIFAKFGSDYRKPDAVTVIDRDNYHELVWGAPASDLLYVGRATGRKLKDVGIRTIGDIANAEEEFLYSRLGKMGRVLSAFARGEDRTPVAQIGSRAPVKSIGNGITAPRDLNSYEDVEIVVYLLAESVGARLREHSLAAATIEIDIRDSGLYSFSRRRSVSIPTNINSDIARYAMSLFRENYHFGNPVRSICVRGSNLVPEDQPVQMNLFMDENQRTRRHQADLAVDSIRRRFGYRAIQRGVILNDETLSGADIKSDNVIHPRGYFDRGNLVGI